MTGEEKELFYKTTALAQKNEERLNRLEKKFRHARIWSIVKILIIVLPLIVAYFFYLTQLSGYSDVENIINSTTGINQIQNLLK